MRFDFKKKEATVERGDVVQYLDTNCLVAEARMEPTIYLISLTTSLIVKEYKGIYDLRGDENITLIAKENELEITIKEEAPF